MVSKGSVSLHTENFALVAGLVLAKSNRAVGFVWVLHHLNCEGFSCTVSVAVLVYYQKGI